MIDVTQPKSVENKLLQERTHVRIANILFFQTWLTLVARAIVKNIIIN